MSKLALRAQTVDIAYLPLRQDFSAKNVLMTAQRGFRLGNSLSRAGPTHIAMLAIGSSWQPGVQVLLLVQVVILALWIMRYLDQPLLTSL